MVVSNSKTLEAELTKSDKYEFYLPAKPSEVQSILVIMDPHGQKVFHMDSLTSFADEHRMALIWLKEIKNGESNFESIISRDLNHFIQYSKISHSKIYFLGFSGAARMAIAYSAKNRIDGLVICGVGLGRQSQLPFPIALICGMGDFNFLEQYYGLNDPKVFQKNRVTFHYNGTHGWPPNTILRDAIYFVMARGINTTDEKAAYFSEKSKSYFNDKNYYLSFRAMEVSYKLSDANHEDQRRKELIDLSENWYMKNYFQRYELYLEEEQKRFQVLAASLDIQDFNWWVNQIKYIDVRSNSKRNQMEAESYSRTKAFMGILMYSRVQGAFQGRNQFALISKYLKIYELVEPENPDMFFFKAVYAYAQNAENDAATYLSKAVELGFNDKNKLQQYFPVTYSRFLN